MYSKPKILGIEGNTIRIAQPTEAEGNIRTYLTANLAASGTSVTVLDNAGLADDDIIRWGQYGEKTCELKSINGAVTTGTALTSTAVTFAHQKGTQLTKILYDQYYIYGAETEAGIKTSVVDSQPIQANEDFSSYTNTSTAYSYYFVRFYNSQASTPFYSDYSDAIPATDFSYNSVSALKRDAADEINVNISSNQADLINHNFLTRQINLCLQNIRGKRNRWSFMQNFDYDLGNLSFGLRRIAMPTDIYDSNTNRSVLGVRIGDGQKLSYIGWNEYQSMMQNTAHTTVATEGAIAATSLVCSDSVDFSATGNVYVGTQTGAIAYTANSSNTLTVANDQITATATVGTDVWQGFTSDEPKYYTIAGGYIYLFPIPSSSWSTQNVFIDYYKVATNVDSDSDSIEAIRYDAVRYWLIWKMLNRKKQMEEASVYKLEYDKIINEMLLKEAQNVVYHFRPARNNINVGSKVNSQNRN